MGKYCDMNELRQYLNNLDAKSQAEFAQRCGTTIGYLRKACSTRPRLDGALCRLLEEESGGAVKKAVLRPDIWPEQINPESAA